MMTPQEWNHLLTGKTAEPDPRKIRKIVGINARKYLMTLAPGLTITTTQLIDALYPREIAERSLTGDMARDELASILLMKLTQGDLQDCCVKGEVSGKYMGHEKRPWLWFAPSRGFCPHCGQVMPEETE